MKFIKNNLTELISYFCVFVAIIATIFISVQLNLDSTRISAYGIEKVDNITVNFIDEKTIVYKIILSDDIHENDVIYFETNNDFVMILHNGAKIYTYGKTETTINWSEDFGKVTHLVELDPTLENQAIYINIQSKDNTKINDDFSFYIDNKNSVILSIVLQNIIEIVVAIIIMIVGIVFLLYTIYMSILKRFDRILLHLSFGIILGSIWLLSITPVLQFLNSNKTMAHLLFVFSFTLFPLPFLLTMRAFFKVKTWKYDIAIYLVLLNFLVRFILSLFKIPAFSSMMIITYFTYLSVIISALIFAYIHRKEKRCKLYAIGVIGFTLITNIAIISYLINKNIHLFFDLIGIGLFFIIIFNVINAGLFLGKLKTEAERAEYFEKCATIDVMTKMGNRFAFDAYINDLQSRNDSKKSIFIILTDLNNLKVTNDFFGHLAGDDLIYGLAECVADTFDEYGKCFRIGGDEFTIILEDISLADAKQLMELFNHRIEEHNYVSSNLIIETAIGYAYKTSDKNSGYSISDLISLADKRMYESKQKRKHIVESTKNNL